VLVVRKSVEAEVEDLVAVTLANRWREEVPKKAPAAVRVTEALEGSHCDSTAPYRARWGPGDCREPPAGVLEAATLPKSVTRLVELKKRATAAPGAKRRGYDAVT